MKYFHVSHQIKVFSFHDFLDEVHWRVTALHRSIVIALCFIQFYKAVSRSVTCILNLSSTELHGYTA